jgi:DnaJ-class molecular chaperone with C-terminal Zn finger domain
MNQSAASKTDPVLSMFDEEVNTVLGEISSYLGLDGISLSMEPKFQRKSATVLSAISVTNEFHSILHKGKATYGDVPAIKRDQVNDYVKREADRLFKAAVSEESLKQAILEGHAVSRGRIVCDEILALSYEDCVNCGADGLLTCGGCSGSGSTDCTHCRFTGHAAGYVTCWSCGGSGGSNDVSTGKWYNCGICHGWKRILCTTCGGSTKVKCWTCGGDGNVYCGPCGGNGYFTRAHGYKITINSGVAIKSEEMNEADRRHAHAWVASGLGSWTKMKDGTLLPHASISDMAVKYDGWKDDAYCIMTAFHIKVTTAEVKATYNGSADATFLYGRYDKPLFAFTSFLDPLVDKPLVDVAKRDVKEPAAYLEAFAHLPGVADGLRYAGSSKDGKQAFLRDADDILRNSVNEGLLDIVADGYLACVEHLEKKASHNAGRDVALAICALWIACWLAGGFEMLNSLKDNHVILANIGVALAVSAVSAHAVRWLTRRSVAAETGFRARYQISRWRRVACFLGGIAFVLAGGLSVAYT